MLIKPLLKRFIIIITMFFLLLLLLACTKKTESIQFLNKESEIHIGEVVPLINNRLSHTTAGGLGETWVVNHKTSKMIK